MLKARDSAALAPGSFRQASVAAQGFPALERLLFGSGAREALIAKGREADDRCRLVVAIASNLRRMGDGIVAGWTAGEPKSFVRFLTSPGPNNPYYATHRDATLDFFKSLYGGLQTIVDVELGPVLGQSLAEARPELAESRLRGRRSEEH